MLRLFDKNNRDITDECQYCSNPSCLGEPWCSAWGICKDFDSLPASTAQENEALLPNEGWGPVMENSSDDVIMEQEIDDIFLELSQHLKSPAGACKFVQQSCNNRY